MWDLRQIRDNLPQPPARRHSPNPIHRFPTAQRVNAIPSPFPGPTPFVPTIPGYAPTFDVGPYYRPAMHHRRIPSDSPYYFPQPQYPPRTRAQSFSHSKSPRLSPHPLPKSTNPVPIPQNTSHHRTAHRRSSHSHLHKLHTSHSQSHLQQPAADFKYSRCTGRKKALCIGINYKGQSHELRGCINDAWNVRRFLISRGYKEGDIVVLTDDAENPRNMPTRKNMIDAMHWLVRNARPDDSLFFHYSGHGGQTKDLDGDELDGLDEVIFPVDFKKNGHIVDDEMHNIMVKPLPAGCRLTALFDACHSGTVLDLPYAYSSHGRLRGIQVSDHMRRILSSPADVISWSGCADEQTSSDTFSGGVAVGAMSNAFITSLVANPKQTYKELLRSIRLILHPRYSQKPQLGSSHRIDTSLGFVI